MCVELLPEEVELGLNQETRRSLVSLVAELVPSLLTGDEGAGVKHPVLCFINGLFLQAEVLQPFPPHQELENSAPVGPVQTPAKDLTGSARSLKYGFLTDFTAASCLNIYFDALFLRH